jgi:hypothetical protein
VGGVGGLRNLKTLASVLPTPNCLDLLTRRETRRAQIAPHSPLLTDRDLIDNKG